MEWSEGDLVWFDPGLGHPLPGEIQEVHRAAQVIVVQALINGKPQTFTLAPGEGSLRPRQDLGTSGVEDMTQLVDLHEASLLWNLRLRYDRGLIYTFAGSILIAVNPYQMFPDSYGLDIAKQYAGRPLGTLPPHLFAIGASAHASLPTPQVVVISGESGSGKTESTKLVMQYLAAVVPGGGSASAVITEQILEAAPLLEAFGNARTARNDNSSRFGKYLEVYFKQGAIVGAKITQYLLEKSRIVTQAPGERNYHVFYELLAGLSEADRTKYGLLEAEKYFYLNQGGSDSAPGRVDWVALQGAMQVLGVSEVEQEGIVRVLASVLHLGNVYFHRRQLRHGQEGVEVGSDSEIKWAAHLLHIPADGLHLSLTTRVTEARSERLHTPLGIDQALDARDAFAKVLYSGLFNWLVSRINSIVHKGGTHDAHRISILDIFGFEDLAENSFEQLCINFANENLQLYFNKHVFKLEQAEYARERLEWDPLSWEDNLPVIHLLAKKPVGIFHLLDDESNFPRASDLSFLEKCHYNHALNEIYSRPRIGAQEFGVTHYAGQVWYCVEGFLEKNRDALRPDVLELLAASKLPLIVDMTRQLRAQRDFGKTMPRGTNGRFVTMKPRTPTVAARFSDSLQQLLQSMAKCNPWFVRCIKPNNDKHALRMDMPCVLQQLRYLGMLDTIRIRQKGYPVRLRFQHFVERYRHMLRGPLPRGTPYRELCRNVLESLPRTGIEGPDFQLGATRVFLREAQHRALESGRSERLRTAAVIIQRHVRGMMTRKKIRSRRLAATRIQAIWRGHKQRRNFTALRKGAITAQALFRGRRQRKQYDNLKTEMKRRRVAEKAKRERQQQQIVKEQERNQVVHLDVPAELAFMFSKMDGWTPVHGDRHLVKVVGTVPGPPIAPDLPADLDQFAFGKFSSVYCNGVKLTPRRDPITVPFLTRAASRDQDFQDSLAVFKLILRWSGDANMDSAKEKALADYIAHKGLSSRGLRDEILVQQCNQLYRAEESQALRIWQLMAHCLSCFQPGPAFAKYLMKFISDNAPAALKEILLKKILRTGNGAHAAPARIFPPAWLEWRASARFSDIAIGLTLPDEVSQTVAIDSWTTCEEAAALAISSLGIPNHGWTVTLDDSGLVTDSCGLDYVLDLVAEKELCSAFPAVRTDLLRSGRKNSRISMSQELEAPSSPKRPQVPPPEPPAQMKQQAQQRHSVIAAEVRRSAERDQRSMDRDMRKMEREPPIMTRTNEVVARKSSHDLLSRSSALNDRYFDSDKSRSRSLDDLLGGGGGGGSGGNVTPGAGGHAGAEVVDSPISHQPEVEPLSQLGLSGSRLNDRYLSTERLAPIVPKETAPRYQKSQYAGRRSAGSHSSKYIDRSDYATRSSAMSDTSEAPSLASHVRRVRVPSQASDVDQFLDELFSPVLDGSLDELSDARSLAASIRGGGGGINDFIEAPFLSANMTELESSEAMVMSIKGGGNGETKPNDAKGKSSTAALDQEVESITNPLEVSLDEYITDLFQPIFVNDSLRRLTEKTNLAEAIKGGGSAHHSGTTNGFVTSPVLMSPKSPLSPSQMHLLNESNGSTPLKSPESPQYAQNMQRAFLQSAMVQNLQIQQQLLAQNQALQTLLSQSAQDAAANGTAAQTSPNASGSVASASTSSAAAAATSSSAINSANTSVSASTTQLDKQSPGRRPSFKSRISSSPFSEMDRFRRTSSESNGSAHIPPPPPPPMPPPIEFKDPSEARPFLDPYGRAKTVRIGKWRWPPPQDAIGLNETVEENFMHFKMRQNQRKHTPQSQASSPNGSPGVEWEEFDIEPNNTTVAIKNSNHHHQQLHHQHSQQNFTVATTTTASHNVQRKFSQPEPVAHQALKTSRRSFEIGAERPPPGSVGKLKLSSEMRQRLEQVTAGHSVRSSTSTKSEQRAPAKLEDARKMMLQQQLSGHLLAGGDRNDINDIQSVRTQIQRMESSRGVQSSTTVWPTILPPAPPGPAPPPPIRPPTGMPPMPPPPVPIVPLQQQQHQQHQQQMQQQHQQQHHNIVAAAPIVPQPEIPAFVQRQERDTFGTHQQQQQHHQQQQNNWNEASSEVSTKEDAFDSWGRAEAAKHDLVYDGNYKKDPTTHRTHIETRERSRSRSRSRDREHFSESVWDRSEVEGPPSSGSDRAVHKEREKRERMYEIRQAERERESHKVYQPPTTSASGNNSSNHNNNGNIGGSKTTAAISQMLIEKSTDNKSATAVAAAVAYDKERLAAYAAPKEKLQTHTAQVHERITYKTHMVQRSMESRSRKTSSSTVHSQAASPHITHNDKRSAAVGAGLDDIYSANEDWGTAAPIIPAPVPVPPSLKSPAAACLTYNRVPWKLRVRKEVFRPSEPVGPPACVDLLFAQITGDVFGQTASLRITASERRNALNLLAGHGVTGADATSRAHVRAIVKRHLIDLARGWPLYFARLFVVSGSPQIPEVSILAVSHSGVYLARRDADHITVIRSVAYGELLGAATLPRPAALQLNLRNGNRTTLHAPRSQAIQTMVQMYCQEYRQIQSKTSTLSSGARAAAQTLNVPLERLEAQVHVNATSPLERVEKQHRHLDKQQLSNGNGHQQQHQLQQQQQQHHHLQLQQQHHAQSMQQHSQQQQQQQQHHHDDIMEYNAQSMSPTSAGRSGSSNGGQYPGDQQMHGHHGHHGKRPAGQSHQQQQQQAIGEHDEIMMHHQQQQQPQHHGDHHHHGHHGRMGEDEDTMMMLMDESSMAGGPNDGGPGVIKYSLLQFAMQHFRNDQPLDDHQQQSPNAKNGNKQQQLQQLQQQQQQQRSGSAGATMRPHADLVKWQGAPIRAPLLRLPPDLSPLALECFECILRYCGDLPPDPELTEVKCVYTVLMHCHKHLTLRDEVYCQLMKQTTANRSPCADSSQRAWRLLSVLAAYFGCSDALKPYLLEHLTAAASDRRRSCHGTAAVCLTNLRKTARCGGRKNVPSVEEVTAVSAGRSARRQIYRLPGGAERVVNTRCSTVVADVIAELCALLGIDSPTEQQEFSLYCIVQGDAFTMPLASDEYILDVTTELLKSAQPFYLIFCRSVWHFQMRREPAPTPLYIEVLFNQVAPDYLEGLLLELPGGGAPDPDVVRDMARIAALLHRAADLNHVPAMKEIKFLLPKPALGIRELRPAQWVALVQSAWPSIAGLGPAQVKAQFLGVLSAWSLFGSSFFAVKRVWAEEAAVASAASAAAGGALTGGVGAGAPGGALAAAGLNGAVADDANPMWRELILALNRRGILFLDPNTHETLQHWPFMEVISTRKVRSEDGALFLDMKVGNLMQQRVIRVQTEQAHEISRLVRQYITMAQGGQQRDRRD